MGESWGRWEVVCGWGPEARRHVHESCAFRTAVQARLGGSECFCWRFGSQEAALAAMESADAGHAGWSRHTIRNTEER
ncbi:MAG: hypothetical protein Q8S13_00855 [Dehalococcoidia bacterium]|nr:hypothetical protein [Dehalococcoidia bacterium]